MNSDALDVVQFIFAIVAALLVMYAVISRYIDPALSAILRFILSSKEVTANEVVEISVPVPVPDTSTAQVVPLDVTTYAGDDEIIRSLALLHVSDNPASAYRFSANKIYALVGGNRPDVLEIVKAYRQSEPREYYSDMQERIRKEVREND